MEKSSAGQSERKRSGNRTEQMIRKILEADPKLKNWLVKVYRTAQGEVDIDLYPPHCKDNPDSKECLMGRHLEVKSVEKLFENDWSSREKPYYNRLSRFVLKPSEANDPNLTCYAFVTHDELSGHDIVDFVDSKPVKNWIRGEGFDKCGARMAGNVKNSKAPKLPVRALPELRMKPCGLVSKWHYITESDKKIERPARCPLSK